MEPGFEDGRVHFATAGRIRQGPAPKNLPVPDYAFLDDTTIRIG